jgi:hypothetical protein
VGVHFGVGVYCSDSEVEGVGKEIGRCAGVENYGEDGSVFSERVCRVEVDVSAV